MTDYALLRKLVQAEVYGAELIAALLDERDALAAKVAEMDEGHCSACGTNGEFIYCGYCYSDD